MEKKYATIQQHEPLRVPANWSGQEKRFIAQLEEILDDIYSRYNRLRLKDLSPEAQEVIEEAAGPITEERIVSGAVTAVKIADGAVIANKIASGAVTVGKIAPDAVTAEKILAGAITAVKIEDGAVTANKVAAGAVETNKLAAGAVTTAKLDTGAVTADKIAAGAITVGKIADDAVTADKIISGAVTAVKIQDGAVIANKIAAGAVTAAKIDVADLFAAQATITQLNAYDIRGNQYLRLAVNRTFSQWADPASTASNNVQDGDIWNKDHGLRKWSDFGTWSELPYTWSSFESGKQYIRKDGAWEQMNDPTGKYSIISGIEIIEPGVEISGRKYVRIRSGGSFLVDSGNFSIDQNGNVKMTGTVEASAGKIGGWTIGADKLSSGSGTSYVQMAVSGDYAFLAGNATESSAPFRVKRDGTVYLKQLITINEQGAETTVDLQNYPFWKLYYHTIKSYNANGITLSNGATINFNTAAQLIIEGSWSGMTFIATVKNGNNETVMSTSESFSGGKGTGSQSTGSIYTINAFDSAHKAHGYVNASPHFQPQRLFTFNVDASGEYQSGYDAGYDAGYAAGWVAAKALINVDHNKIEGPSDTVDGLPVILYTVTANGWVNSIVNNAPGYYTASGEAHAYIDGADVASAGFTKTVHFS